MLYAHSYAASFVHEVGSWRVAVLPYFVFKSLIKGIFGKAVILLLLSHRTVFESNRLERL